MNLRGYSDNYCLNFIVITTTTASHSYKPRHADDSRVVGGAGCGAEPHYCRRLAVSVSFREVDRTSDGLCTRLPGRRVVP